VICPEISEMLKNLKIQFARSLLIAVLFLFASPVTAVSTFIQGGHSGGWVDPTEGGHGVFVEVIVNEASPTGLSVVIAWYAFIDGKPTWIVGIGNVSQDGSGQVANISAFIYEGNDFPPLYDPSQTMEIPWGTMTLKFDGCDNAEFTYNSTIAGYGSGSIDLERFTTIAASSCNPKLGDDDTETDDHGDLWQTATAFILKNFPDFSDKISGKMSYSGDIDVFTFVIYKDSEISLFSEGDYDPMGTVYEITGNVETLIITDDNSGDEDNFRIETMLEAGTYSLHVKKSILSTENTGNYLLTLVVNQL
jgi:hypothetical protein